MQTPPCPLGGAVYLLLNLRHQDWTFENSYTVLHDYLLRWGYYGI